MFKVTSVSFHAATQTFCLLINSIVDNGLLLTGPRSNQTRVQHKKKQVNKLTNESVYRLSREIK